MDELMVKLDLLSDCCRVLEAHSTNDFILSKSLLQIKDIEVQLDQAKQAIKIRTEMDKKRLERMQHACDQLSKSSEGQPVPALPQLFLKDLSVSDSNFESSSESDNLKIAEKMREILLSRGFTPDLESDASRSLRREVEILSAARQEATAQLDAYHGLPASLPEAKAFVDRIKAERHQ